MGKGVLLALAVVLLLLIPAVALPHVADVKRELKKLTDESEAMRDVKKHVHAMQDELKESLHEKGVEFKKGMAEGEAWSDWSELKPVVNEKLNEAAHGAGFVAGAAKAKAEEAKEAAKDKFSAMKEKVEEAREKAREKAEEAKEAAKDKFDEMKEKAREKAEEAKERVKDKFDEMKEKVDRARHAATETAREAKEKINSATEAVKETIDDLSFDARKAAHLTAEKLENLAHASRDELDDLLGHARYKTEYYAAKLSAPAKERIAHLREELEVEGEQLQHTKEAIKEKGRNLADELRTESKIIKKDVQGMWGWLKHKLFGTSDTVQVALKREEYNTKATIAAQLRAAASKEEKLALQALFEYQELRGKIHHARPDVTPLLFSKERSKLWETSYDAAKFKLDEAARRAAWAAREHREHDCQQDANLQKEAKTECTIREDMRHAKEQRAYVTETANLPPPHHRSISDFFRALNPFVRA